MSRRQDPNTHPLVEWYGLVRVLYQIPGSFVLLCIILAVLRAALFWTETSDVVPGIYWSHCYSLQLLMP